MADYRDSRAGDHLPAGLRQPDKYRKGLYCQACGLRIPTGGLFYIGRTEIISGSDGILPDIESNKADSLINEALDEIAKGNKEDLMESVYQEIKIILCGGCRLKLRQAVLSMLRY